MMTILVDKFQHIWRFSILSHEDFKLLIPIGDYKKSEKKKKTKLT